MSELNEMNGKKNETKKPAAANEAFEWVQTLISVVLIATVLFTFFVRTVIVDGKSMNPTLQSGDMLLSSRLFFEPQYGDIVVVNQPNDHEKVLIKRVIATEGQEVFVDFENSAVYVDGVEMDSSFINGRMNVAFGNEGPVIVPEGCVYVCGDNRNHSYDSRTPSLGFIRTDYISGKIVFGLNPFGTGMLYK